MNGVGVGAGDGFDSEGSGGVGGTEDILSAMVPRERKGRGGSTLRNRNRDIND